MVKPKAVRLRMYRVGFGDCFLLSLEYPKVLDDGRRERHILIDFGTMRLPRGARDLRPIAKLIHDHTGGQIDVVVVSHRHKDHLSAFASPQVVESLVAPGYPRRVLLPWTEHPDAPRSARSADAEIGPRSRAFVRSIAASDRLAEKLTAKLAAAPSNSLAGRLRTLADDQIANAHAVRQLALWSQPDRGHYLHYGSELDLDDVLPGIGVRVIGPPTVDQHPAVARQRSRDPAEFWMIYEQLVERLRADDLLAETESPEEADKADADATREDVPDVLPGEAPDPSQLEAPQIPRPQGEIGPVRWLTDRMRRQQVNSLLRIVRSLDDALNNTSLILLFDIPGGRSDPVRLLFGGDAQIENWEYALKFAADCERNRSLLRGVDLYKVGHHGSRNATPRSLFGLWTEPATISRPMTALMSTRAGVHGESAATKVPRKTLVAALDTRMTLYTSQSLKSDRPFLELQHDLRRASDFRVVSA